MIINASPLDLISKSFYFRDNNPVHPSLSNLGICKVVSVVVHESGDYELGLSDGSDSDVLDYYPMGQLDISVM